ncbi:hypothetical protein [Indioceanicola profundi]|uniref:hypothetical protein n=1 Tax=Indioceanicola profundi TaxID=2220096 RepID=UPI0013C539C4|nr:hypothetical protein [Indioceanicola profundi]
MRPRRHATRMTAASLIIPAMLMAGTAAMAQDAPAYDTERPAQTHDQNEPGGKDSPNWPESLGNWDTSDRESGPGDPNEAERRGLTSPEVQRSLAPAPTMQGTRAPDTDTAGPAVSPGNNAAEAGTSPRTPGDSEPPPVAAEPVEEGGPGPE